MLVSHSYRVRDTGIAPFRTSYRTLPTSYRTSDMMSEQLIVRLKLSTGDLTVVNVYHRPSDNIPDGVINDYRKLFNAYNHSSIIFDDLNAYSTLFGADSTDDRGRLLEELIEEHNLVVLNTGAGTFVRPSGEMNHLDIAMASAMASANITRIANWTVPDDTIGSEHLPIVITVNDQPSCRRRKFSTALDVPEGRLE